MSSASYPLKLSIPVECLEFPHWKDLEGSKYRLSSHKTVKAIISRDLVHSPRLSGSFVETSNPQTIRQDKRACAKNSASCNSGNIIFFFTLDAKSMLSLIYIYPFLSLKVCKSIPDIRKNSICFLGPGLPFNDLFLAPSNYLRI